MGKRSSQCHPCLESPIEDGLKLILAMELMFGIAFMCHGGYLMAVEIKAYGGAFLLIGIAYYFLSWGLREALLQPNYSRLKCWILSSVTVQTIIIILTILRNVQTGSALWGVNVWITLGFLIQSYMIWVVWAFMNEWRFQSVLIDAESQSNAKTIDGDGGANSEIKSLEQNIHTESSVTATS